MSAARRSLLTLGPPQVVYTINQPRNKKAKGSATSADENGGARASDDSDDDFEVEIAADESGDDYEMQELDKDDFPGEKVPKAKREPRTGLARPLVQLSAEELARRSNGKSQARIANIDSLARAAFVFQDSTVNRILSEARMATRPEQSAFPQLSVAAAQATDPSSPHSSPHPPSQYATLPPSDRFHELHLTRFPCSEPHQRALPAAVQRAGPHRPRPLEGAQGKARFEQRSFVLDLGRQGLRTPALPIFFPCRHPLRCAVRTSSSMFLSPERIYACLRFLRMPSSLPC